MSVALPVLLFALGGLLAGGALSLQRQGAPRGTIAVVALLGLLAVAGGVAWLIPEGR